jgi:hypothetical protein
VEREQGGRHGGRRKEEIARSAGLGRRDGGARKGRAERKTEEKTAREERRGAGVKLMRKVGKMNEI